MVSFKWKTNSTWLGTENNSGGLLMKNASGFWLAAGKELQWLAQMETICCP